MKNTTGFTNSARFRCLEDLQKDSMELCLIYCGWEACESGHRYGPNKRTSYLIHIVKDGKGTLEINNKIYHLTRGDAFFIPPRVNAWYEADKKDPWTYMWIGYTGLKAQECTESAGFSPKEPVRQIEHLKEIHEYLEGILEAHQLSYENELRRNGFLMLIFSLLVREHHKNLPGAEAAPYAYPGSVYVKHAVEYMTFHYANRVKINEMADYIGVNRSYLSSSFKKAMGCSPQEYLVNIRLDKAKSLLKKTNIPINEIAAQVGYCDQLAFSKIFKRYFGISPRVYRETEDELVISKEKGDYVNTKPI